MTVTAQESDEALRTIQEVEYKLSLSNRDGVKLNLDTLKGYLAGVSQAYTDGFIEGGKQEAKNK